MNYRQNYRSWLTFVLLGGVATWHSQSVLLAQQQEPEASRAAATVASGDVPRRPGGPQVDVEDGAGDASVPRKGRVLIVSGLPGDAEHAMRFGEIRRRWIAWLTGAGGFRTEQVVVLHGREPTEGAEPATRDNLERVLETAASELDKEGRLWLMFLGHGNEDGRRAYFHLPGPDIDDRTLGVLLAKFECAEQVVWLTHSCSGGFVRASSRPGRVIVAATAGQGEVNETEFPAALAEVLERPPARLDADQDGVVSVADLFTLTATEVEARYETNQRLPTEHAQLDDNGDGTGTELAELQSAAPELPELAEEPEGATPAEAEVEAPPPLVPVEETPPPAVRKSDGELARATVVLTLEAVDNRPAEQESAAEVELPPADAM